MSFLRSFRKPEQLLLGLLALQERSVLQVSDSAASPGPEYYESLPRAPALPMEITPGSQPEEANFTSLLAIKQDERVNNYLLQKEIDSNTEVLLPVLKELAEDLLEPDHMPLLTAPAAAPSQNLSMNFSAAEAGLISAITEQILEALPVSALNQSLEGCMYMALPWGQCGGLSSCPAAFNDTCLDKQWPSVCCPPTNSYQQECMQINRYYFQCLPSYPLVEENGAFVEIVGALAMNVSFPHVGPDPDTTFTVFIPQEQLQPPPSPIVAAQPPPASYPPPPLEQTVVFSPPPPTDSPPASGSGGFKKLLQVEEGLALGSRIPSLSGYTTSTSASDPSFSAAPTGKPGMPLTVLSVPPSAAMPPSALPPPPVFSNLAIPTIEAPAVDAAAQAVPPVQIASKSPSSVTPPAQAPSLRTVAQKAPAQNQAPAASQDSGVRILVGQQTPEKPIAPIMGPAPAPLPAISQSKTPKATPGVQLHALRSPPASSPVGAPGPGPLPAATPAPMPAASQRTPNPTRPSGVGSGLDAFQSQPPPSDPRIPGSRQAEAPIVGSGSPAFVPAPLPAPMPAPYLAPRDAPLPQLQPQIPAVPLAQTATPLPTTSAPTQTPGSQNAENNPNIYGTLQTQSPPPPTAPPNSSPPPPLLVPSPPPAPAEPGLIWSDEFQDRVVNSTNGVNLEKWSFMNGDGSLWNIPGWGDNELEIYTEDNALVSGGVLSITAGYNGTSFQSAKLRTWGLKEFTPLSPDTPNGIRIEASIQLPQGGQGIWPTFWMLPSESTEFCSGCGAYGSWPASGEIDIMDAVNDMNAAYATVHYGGPGGGKHISQWTQGPVISSLSQGFHTYAVDWKADQMVFSVDSSPYFTVACACLSSNSGYCGSTDGWYTTNPAGAPIWGACAPFDRPFYIILSLAVGGGWAGNPTLDTVFPQSMLVDYVRVYRL